jgi:hypothetical protein
MPSLPIRTRKLLRRSSKPPARSIFCWLATRQPPSFLLRRKSR